MKEPTRRQITAMCFLILLSPATRLIPGAAASAAGHAGWLCPIAAAPLCALVAVFISRVMKNKGCGEGLGEVILRAFPRFGRCVLLIYGLWLALYAGFALRSGASRFIYTIYTGSSPWPFVAVGLAVGLVAALGSVKRLARSAELFRALLLLAIVPIIGFGLAQLDWDELLPVSYLDAPGVSLGALEVLAALTYPFFALVRNTGLFGVAERIEALVTGLWVLSDFVLCAFALMSSSLALRLSLGLRERPGAVKALSPRALTTAACACAALACALVIAPDSRSMRIISDAVVVYVNLAMIFVLMLPTLAVGVGRGRI